MNGFGFCFRWRVSENHQYSRVLLVEKWKTVRKLEWNRYRIMPETRGLSFYFPPLTQTPPTPPPPSLIVFPRPPHYFPSTTTANTSTKFLLSFSSHYLHYFYYFPSTVPLLLFSLHQHFYRQHYHC